MRQALEQVKKALGPNAVILSTRSLKETAQRNGGALRPSVEVTAAAESESVPVRPIRRTRPIGSPARPLSSPGDERLGLSDPYLGEEVRELAFMVQTLLRSAGTLPAAGLPHELMLRYRHLLAGGVDETLAGRLISRVADRMDCGKGFPGSAGKKGSGGPDDLEQGLLRILKEDIPVAGPVRPRSGERLVTAFVGPTGVGKTTTIAKIASDLTIVQKKRTALVTIDTYRIAAVEQLRIYARILKIPCLVVNSRKALQAALAKLDRAEVVLIDTAGRSQRNPGQMQALTDVLSVDEEIETHLVLSSTTRERDLIDAWRRFSVAMPDRLLFTKIDESSSFGGLYNVALYSGRPISYLTTGQQVPEDIEVAKKERVAELVLRSPLH